MLIRGIRKKISESNIKIKFGKTLLKVVSEIKYLGIIIDKNLRFTAHVDYLEKKIGSKMGLLHVLMYELACI